MFWIFTNVAVTHTSGAPVPATCWLAEYVHALVWLAGYVHALFWLAEYVHALVWLAEYVHALFWLAGYVHALFWLAEQNGDFDRSLLACQSSVTSMMVTAMATAVRSNWLPATKRYLDAVDRGWSGITSHVSANGTVTGVCMGTVSAWRVPF